MTSSESSEQRTTPSLPRLTVREPLLWITGAGLRITILAVPPLIPLIRADLHMSETEVGMLSGLPQVLFACAAVPGSMLIARFGALPMLVVGLLTTALGSALRGATFGIAQLFAATVITGFGVAIMQPGLPALVRAWLPQRVGFGSVVFSNGMLIGEILPVALTLPWVLPLVGSWRLALVAWAVPVALIALALAAFAPRSASSASTAQAKKRWWPDWNNPLIWQLGLMFGGVNAVYFGTNAFMPEFLHHTQRPHLIGPALTALNVGQLPASMILLPTAERLLHQAWAYIAAGLLCLAAVLGIMLGNAELLLVSAGVLGFAVAAVFVLIIALPSLLSAPEDVHRTSAAMFTISYSWAVIVPILSGLSWDTTGQPLAAFAPIGLSTCLLITLAPAVVRRSHAPAPVSRSEFR